MLLLLMKKTPDQSGFVTMIVIMIILLGLTVFFAYKNVVS